MTASVNQPDTNRYRRLRTAAALGLFLIVLGAMSWRLYEHRGLPGTATRDRWALASFRDAIYYPLLAVSDGVNPYDCVRNDDPDRYMQRYPVGDTLPLYSPLMLLVFAPSAWLPFDASCIAFTGLNVLLFVLLAWLTLRVIGQRPGIAGVFTLAALLLASQPGRGVFNSGQVALPLALAAIGALHWGDRHVWKSSALVAFLTIKPTFGGPLGLLLAARRDWRSTLGGFVIGGALCVVGMVIIFARSGDLSVERMTQVLLLNQSDFYHDPTVVPAGNKTRVDLPATVDYLTGQPLADWVAALVAAGVLGLTGWVLWRAHRSGTAESATSTTTALAILAMYVCMYHSVYDLPLLVVPIAACASTAHTSWRHVTPAWRWGVLVLLLIPFVNVFWTDGFQAIIQQAGIPWGESGGAILAPAYRLSCAANGLALTGAWLILLVCVARARDDKPRDRPRSSRRKAVHVDSLMPSQVA